MSLDLVKDALFQHLQTTVPDLVFLPEHQPDVDPDVLSSDTNPPLLSFADVSTVREADPPQAEFLTVTVDDALLALPVLARFQTTWRLQLRQRPGPNRSISQIRATAAQLSRALSRLRALDLGPTASLAVFWLQTTHQAFDEANQAHLDEFTQLVEWKLIEVPSEGSPLYLANTIDVYLNGHLQATIS